MREIYKSDLWQKLHGIKRAQLIMVLEELRRGTTIHIGEVPLPEFKEMIENEGFFVSLNDGVCLTVNVGYKETIQELNEKLSRLPKNANFADEEEIYGWFYGYPKCCVKEYSRGIIEEKRNLPKYILSNFAREIYELIKKEGTYPDIFDYRPPTFTPCSIYCKETIEYLKKCKETICNIDPDAAEILVNFNRAGLPERLAYY